MILLAVILFAAALLFGVMALRISRGKTELIHDYHRTRVTDKAGYGKAFGRALWVIAIAMALAGGIALVGEKAVWAAIAVLFLGLAVGIAAIFRVQKKYNGGVF